MESSNTLRLRQTVILTTVDDQLRCRPLLDVVGRAVFLQNLFTLLFPRSTGRQYFLGTFLMKRTCHPIRD